jgi:hypothetical protein
VSIEDINSNPDTDNDPVIVSKEDVTRENVDELIDSQRPVFPLSFSFNCYGVDFSADGYEGDEGPILQVSGNLGPIPYSAESIENRKAIGDILSLSPEFLNLRMSLSEENDVVIEGELPLGGSITPSRIVATASAFVASAKPLIEVIRIAAPSFGSETQPA